MVAPSKTAFWLGGCTAVLQVAVASRWPGGGEHLGAVALGWFSALALVSGKGRPAGCRVRALEVLAGMALWAVACIVTVEGHAAYRTADRLLPLAAGVGLALAAAGVRGLRGHLREFLLLALPLVAPLPIAVRPEPVRLTAVLAGLYLGALGQPVQVEGSVLRMPGSTLEVMAACSGTTVATQLLLLAVLVLLVFPSGALQKALVVLSAIALGYGVNAARVATLAVLAEHAPDRYAYWDGQGSGAPMFPAVATLAAAVLWWLILRRGRPVTAAACLEPGSGIARNPP